MKHQVRHGLIGCLLIGLLSGCASVTTGKDQTLAFDTDPVGAVCVLAQSGQTLGRFQTPSTLVVRRNAAPLVLTCTKSGYHDLRAVIGSTLSAGAWGNLLVGGVYGAMVDQSTGAANRYYDPPKFTLVATTEAPPQAVAKIAPGVTVVPPGSRVEAALEVDPAPPPTAGSPASSATGTPEQSPTPPPPMAAPASGQSRSRL